MNPPQPHEAPAHVGQSPSAHPELDFELPAPAKPGAARLWLLGGGLAAVIGAGLLFGFVPKMHAQSTLTERTRDRSEAATKLEVVTPTRSGTSHAVKLPGTVRPLEETVLFPRANGYVRNWLVDLGDAVKEGQLLAEIDTPELDQQIAQANAELARAQAQVVQSQAQQKYAEQALARVQKLAPEGVASQQELDQQVAQGDIEHANLRVAQANVAAQQANVRRLTQLKSFAKVTAPFAGTVTARMVERGALVSASGGSPLFRLTQADTVRIIVQVPQGAALGVKAGEKAKVSVREYHDRVFEADIARVAGALDPATRTMPVELRIPNPKGELLSGMFTDVELQLPMPHSVYAIPATALIASGAGLQVAVVQADQTLRLVSVQIERDLGPSIELASGLAGDERVVKLGSTTLHDGQRVAPSEPAPPAAVR